LAILPKRQNSRQAGAGVPMLNKDKFTFLLAAVLGGLCPQAALADAYQIWDYGLEVPIPVGWHEKLCTDEPPAPNHGFAVPFYGQGCEDILEKPRIDFFVVYDVVVMASRPEELIDDSCEKNGAKRTRYFSRKMPIFECNDIHEKNGFTAKKYFLLRKYSYKHEFGSRVVSATYYWKGNDYNPAYKQEALNLLINVHWLDDKAGQKLRGWKY
jgi:hypothetical protein